MPAKRNRAESGFAMLYVVMLMTALLVMLGAAASFLYAMRGQNAKDKQALVQKASEMNGARK